MVRKENQTSQVIEGPFRRILIIRLSGIGDVVHVLPFLAEVRHRFKDAYIAWLVQKKAEGILRGNPYLDEIIVFDRKRWLRGIVSVVTRLRKLKFDLVIDCHGQLRSGVFAWLSGAKTRLGFNRKDSREFNWLFVNYKASPICGVLHAVDRYIALGRLLGITTREKREFLISLSERDKVKIEDFLAREAIAPEDTLVGLSPGSSWRSKIWDEEKYALLADRLIGEDKVRVVFLWGPGEETLVKHIVNLMKEKPLISPPTDLKELTFLISRCDLFIGTDSAALHLACALSVPSIGLYGPTDPRRNGPYGEGNIAIKKDISRLPCRKKGCRRCKKNDCMGLISVEEVLIEVRKKLVEITTRKD